MTKTGVANWVGLAAALGIVGGLAGGAPAAPACYELDGDHTLVGFLVDHVGFAKTFGQFQKVEGSFCFDEQARALSAVRVVADAASITTLHAARDRHLRSGDFLDARKHPAITFVGTASAPSGDRQGTVTGDLTLLGQTRPLTLAVTWNKSDRYPFGDKHHAIGISARGSLKRSEFGMSYGVADGLVGDQVDILIEFEARRKD